MREEDFGSEGIAAEDRAYSCSCFCEVRDAIFANPYQKVWGRDGEPPLPHYKAKVSNFLRGFCLLVSLICLAKLQSARSIPTPICAGVRTGRASAALSIQMAYA